MKNLFIFGIYILSLTFANAQSVLSPGPKKAKSENAPQDTSIGVRAQSANISLDSTQKYHKYLMQKSESFLAPYVSSVKHPGKIDQRINKTQKFIDNSSDDTAGIQSKINLLRGDVFFYGEILQKSDSLMKLLIQHDKYCTNHLDGDVRYKLGKDNENEITTVQDIIGAATSAKKQAKKMLDRLYGEMGRANN